MHRYEGLRIAKTESLERNLLIQRGMSTWMHVWASSPACTDMRQRASRDDGATADVPCGLTQAIPGAVKSQVAQVLAGLITEVGRR